MTRLALLVLLLLAVSRIVAAERIPPANAHPLKWDAMEKTLDAKPGDTAASFEFRVTNTASERVEIQELSPSCGCTVADMPATPWILEPGASGSFRATADFKGKHGRFSKSIHVRSSAGIQLLSIIVNIPEPDAETRRRNQELALANRQAVFSGDCASCHVKPTIGKTGHELFVAACGICHLAPHRAAMVPDLYVARESRDADYWRRWISDGKEKTLMPGFAKRHGGPLTDEQIESLIAFAVASLPREPLKN